MYCKNCGNANAQGKFCDVCGAKLEAENIASAQPVQEPIIVQAQNVVENTPNEASDPGRVLGLIGMILGIVGAVLSVVCCIYNAYGVCFPFAVAGLVLSLIGSKKSKAAGFTNSKAKLGLILSIVALVIYVLMVVTFIILYAVGMSASILSSY